MFQYLQQLHATTSQLFFLAFGILVILAAAGAYLTRHVDKVLGELGGIRDELDKLAKNASIDSDLTSNLWVAFDVHKENNNRRWFKVVADVRALTDAQAATVETLGGHATNLGNFSTSCLEEFRRITSDLANIQGNADQYRELRGDIVAGANERTELAKEIDYSATKLATIGRATCSSGSSWSRR